MKMTANRHNDSSGSIDESRTIDVKTGLQIELKNPLQCRDERVRFACLAKDVSKESGAGGLSPRLRDSVARS
jgi:hypothetical protein